MGFATMINMNRLRELTAELGFIPATTDAAAIDGRERQLDPPIAEQVRECPPATGLRRSPHFDDVGGHPQTGQKMAWLAYALAYRRHAVRPGSSHLETHRREPGSRRWLHHGADHDFRFVTSVLGPVVAMKSSRMSTTAVGASTCGKCPTPVSTSSRLPGTAA